MRGELLNPEFENFLNSENPENSANSPFAAATGRACPARSKGGSRGGIKCRFRFSAKEKNIQKSNSRITKLSDKMGKKFILFNKETQMSEELLILGFENSLNSEKSLISANSPALTGRAERKEIQKFKSRITIFSEKMGKNFILNKRKSA